MRNRLILFFWAVLLAFSYAGNASAYVITNEQEARFGNNLSEIYEQMYRDVVGNPYQDKILLGIQESIVETNPDKLWLWKNRPAGEERGIWGFKIVPNIEELTAMSFPAGHIYVTSGLVALFDGYKDNGETDIKVVRKRSPYSLYSNSMFAFLLAHEMSHWAHKDFQRTYNTPEKASKILSVYDANGRLKNPQVVQGILDECKDGAFVLQSEREADDMAMRLLANHHMFSLGGGIMFMERLAALEKIQGITDTIHTNSPHDYSQVRANRIKQYISTISGGRVRFDEQNRLWVDGELWYHTGYVPSTNMVTAKERTYYFAGQLASAIAKGYLNPNAGTTVSFFSIHDHPYFKERNMYSVVLNNERICRYMHWMDKFGVLNTAFEQVVREEIKPEGYDSEYMIYLIHYFNKNGIGYPR